MSQHFFHRTRESSGSELEWLVTHGKAVTSRRFDVRKLLWQLEVLGSRQG